MKKINKNIPIVVLQALRDFIASLDSTRGKLFQIVDHDEFLLKMTDEDRTSGFYFNIESFDAKAGLLVSYKPQNKTNTDSNRFWCVVGDIPAIFKIWHGCLDELHDLDIFFKDPFLNNLENDFLADAGLDEENKNKPLHLKQIYFLDEFLAKIETEIIEYQNVENIAEIGSIIEETAYLRTQLGKQSKEWIAKKISAILAKITKEGPIIFKNIFKEVGKQVVSQGIKFLFEHPDKLLG